MEVFVRLGLTISSSAAILKVIGFERINIRIQKPDAAICHVNLIWSRKEPSDCKY